MFSPSISGSSAKQYKAVSCLRRISGCKQIFYFALFHREFRKQFLYNFKDVRDQNKISCHTLK